MDFSGFLQGGGGRKAWRETDVDQCQQTGPGGGVLGAGWSKGSSAEVEANTCEERNKATNR